MWAAWGTLCVSLVYWLVQYSSWNISQFSSSHSLVGLFVHLVVLSISSFLFYFPSCIERHIISNELLTHLNRRKTHMISLKVPGIHSFTEGSYSYIINSVQFEDYLPEKRTMCETGYIISSYLLNWYEVKCHKVQPVVFFFKLGSTNYKFGMLLKSEEKYLGPIEF